MSRSVLARMRLIGPLTFAASLGIGTLPALAQTAPTTAPAATGCAGITFDLANPSPGSMIVPGGLVLQGTAMDARAQSGLGVDHIDFFLDNRDQGGVNLGTVVPGMVPGPFGPASFETTVSIPNVVGGHDLFAYAYSSVAPVESVISIPVAVGEDPSKAGDLGTTTTEMCVSGNATTAPVAPVTTTTIPASTTTTEVTPATTPPASTTTTTTTVALTSSMVTFDVSNPSAGDTIHVGGYAIEGTAVDKAAMSGSGIDRIEIFLDNRDTGGVMLTTATPAANDTWSVIAPLPTNQTGLHSLYFYAHSSVSGQESVVVIPVTIAP